MHRKRAHRACRDRFVARYVQPQHVQRIGTHLGQAAEFHLQEDPAESRNLAKQQPQLVQELSDRMDAFAAEVEASRRPAAGEKNR